MAGLHLFDRGRRELFLFAAIAIFLVLVRCFVTAWYEGFDFDSDQAIVGLMAKHLSELRTFPLFFYGQHYMLAVEAWLAAPLFWLAPATVTTLKLPLYLINIVMTVVLATARTAPPAERFVEAEATLSAPKPS